MTEDRAKLLALTHEELVDRYVFLESQYEDANTNWRKWSELADVWIQKSHTLEQENANLKQEIEEYDRVLDTVLKEKKP